MKESDGRTLVSTTVKNYFSNIIDLTSPANRAFWSLIVKKVAFNDARLKARLKKLLELQSMLLGLENESFQNEVSFFDDETPSKCEVDALDKLDWVDRKTLLSVLSRPKCEIYKLLKYRLAFRVLC